MTKQKLDAAWAKVIELAGGEASAIWAYYKKPWSENALGDALQEYWVACEEWNSVAVEIE